MKYTLWREDIGTRVGNMEPVAICVAPTVDLAQQSFVASSQSHMSPCSVVWMAPTQPVAHLDEIVSANGVRWVYEGMCQKIVLDTTKVMTCAGCGELIIPSPGGTCRHCREALWSARLHDIDLEPAPLTELLDRHRAKAHISCDPTCFCWDVSP